MDPGEPDTLLHAPDGAPKRILDRNGPGHARGRVPAGHPEGYLEGFANLYFEAALAIRAHREGHLPLEGVSPSRGCVFGVAFVDTCVRSSRRDAVWVALA